MSELIALGGPVLGDRRVQSRRGHDISDSFADVAEAAFKKLPAGIVLDGELVAVGEQDARGLPLRERRAALEALLAEVGLPLQAVPQTTDPKKANEWMSDYAASPVGLEGVVIKGQNQRYLGGTRGWLKVRVRDTIEVIVGAITGSLSAPDRLMLGLYTDNGELRIVAGTGSLTATAKKELKPLLEAATTHPWPEEISGARLGRWGARRHGITRVKPNVVVEVRVDNSIDRGRWRHVASLVRVRPDLLPNEVATIEP